ncbi:CPBP family glutamic-type intramembrane protease [Enterococcus sp. AZ072]|uniref:CPBP family glutamic-type intramembrane protease n=1 Tax=unclassified Enterococcus TaxID=2608891 RepID=UPI003D2A24D5
MLDEIEQTRPNRRGLIATPFLLAIGFIGRTTDWPLSWIWLFLFSLLALLFQFGPDACKLFLKPMGKGKIRYIILFVVLSFVLSTIAARLGNLLLNNQTVENPIAQSLHENSLLQNIYFFLTTWISLAGEELTTAAVAFPLYYYLVKQFGQKQAFLFSSILSALFFGSLHLTTYSWNWYQSLVVIGLTRLPFNYAWKKTDSLRGGIIAHTVYDYLIFFFVLLAGMH